MFNASMKQSSAVAIALCTAMTLNNISWSSEVILLADPGINQYTIDQLQHTIKLDTTTIAILEAQNCTVQDVILSDIPPREIERIADGVHCVILNEQSRKTLELGQNEQDIVTYWATHRFGPTFMSRTRYKEADIAIDIYHGNGKWSIEPGTRCIPDLRQLATVSMETKILVCAHATALANIFLPSSI